MRWTKPGAHLLLPIRTEVLDVTEAATFQQMLSAFSLASFPFGRLTVIGDVAFQAVRGGMPAKAFEIGFGVIMGSTQADRRVAELVEIPAGGIAFQSVSACRNAWRA